LRQYSGPLFAIEETMRNMNSVMRTILNEGYYLTACYAQLSRSRRTLRLVNAGHPPPIVISRDGESKLIRAEGDPLGVFGSVVFQKQEVELRPGDRFYLYTDGLIEDQRLPAAGRSLGLERLANSCGNRRDVSLNESVRAIVADVKPDLSAVDDDLLLLGVEVRL
jgi:sigma-B regulation protein RsbU (phosphoserine phosphatase)